MILRIMVRAGRPAAGPSDQDPLARWSRLPVAAQPESASGIEAWRLGFGCEKVLSDKQVLLSIPVEVADGHSEHGGQLRFHGQIARFEFSAAVQKDFGCEGDCLDGFWRPAGPGARPTATAGS